MPYIAQQLSVFTQKEIRTILRKALRAYKGPGLDILLVPASREFGRILVITPRKVGNAPERNKIRRRLKALFYQEEFYRHNLDWCIILKKPGITYGYEELKPLLSSVLKQQSVSV